MNICQTFGFTQGFALLKKSTMIFNYKSGISVQTWKSVLLYSLPRFFNKGDGRKGESEGKKRRKEEKEVR
jgi:hypothetical protein